MLHEMEIAGLALDSSSNTPILILKSKDGKNTVPIWIGLLEAASIAMAIQNVDFARPMTHDLFKSFMDTLKVRVERVEVCDLRDNTFFAQIYFTSPERSFNMDARPSDAIAIALRAKAPILVDDLVLTKSAAMEPTGEMTDRSEEGERWAEYLSRLDPEDFGKYKM